MNRCTSLVGELGMAERLHYFGRVHQHAEASHAKDQHDPVHPSYVPSEDERTTAAFLVDQVFDTFERMFDCWHAAPEQPVDASGGLRSPQAGLD